MAALDPQSECERLFSGFLAPLVLGGTVVPGKPFGGKQALSFGSERRPTDADLLSRTELVRVRVARKVAPIDTLSPGPDENEWALGAALHDLVQSTHPDLAGLFRRSGPGRILDIVELTLERVPSPANVGDSLSRHTWFSRMFEVTRSDTYVRWRTGSQHFLGTEPPKRLLMWPEFRGVKQTHSQRTFMELPTSGAAVDADRFTTLVSAFLEKTPLTDLGTLTRSSPAFAWTHENLSLCATPSGRTIVCRALSLLPQREVDRALGRATKQLLAQKAVRALLVATVLLRERALEAAVRRLAENAHEQLASGADDDASVATGIGALAASHWLTQGDSGFAETERRSLLDFFAPAANAISTPEVRALLLAGA